MNTSRKLALFLSVLMLSAGPVPCDEGDTAARILGRAMVDNRAYDKLAWLCDRIGARPSGSENLQRAIDWAQAEFRRDGIERVWTEEVMAPHWERGVEEARIVSPSGQPMAISALGGSIGTPEGGITAEVVEVSSFEQLEALGDAVRGKIVLYNKEIFAGGGREHGYGSAAGLRVRGAIRAARQGALATLVRSLGTADFRLPHTGMMRYDEEVPKIPSAAVSAEDAELIHRLLASGEPVRVHLVLGCRNLPEVTSANVIAEIPGREIPEEIVLVGCHLDSWDVGTGAIDDGVGCAMVMEAMRIVRSMDRPPRRTLRAVLFTAEENGIWGGNKYAQDHADELDRHVAAMEMDSGGGAVEGFGVSAGSGGVEFLREIAARLAGIGASEVREGGGGPDISPTRKAGVPQLGLRQDTTHYFDYHHSPADTLDKVDRGDLNRNTAAVAVMVYLLADHEETLPRLEPPENDTRP
jgi:hypothetical protein